MRMRKTKSSPPTAYYAQPWSVCVGGTNTHELFESRDARAPASAATVWLSSAGRGGAAANARAAGAPSSRRQPHFFHSCPSGGLSVPSSFSFS